MIIDTKVPIPNPYKPNGRNSGSQYPLDELQPGDSFFLGGENALSRLGSATSYYYLKHGKRTRFTVRKVTENGIEGGRCWRLV